MPTTIRHHPMTLRDLHNEDPHDGGRGECPLCARPGAWWSRNLWHCRACGEVDPAEIRALTQAVNEPEPTEETEA